MPRRTTNARVRKTEKGTAHETKAIFVGGSVPLPSGGMAEFKVQKIPLSADTAKIVCNNNDQTGIHEFNGLDVRSGIANKSARNMSPHHGYTLKHFSVYGPRNPNSVLMLSSTLYNEDDSINKKYGKCFSFITMVHKRTQLFESYRICVRKNLNSSPLILMELINGYLVTLPKSFVEKNWSIFAPTLFDLSLDNYLYVDSPVGYFSLDLETNWKDDEYNLEVYTTDTKMGLISLGVTRTREFVFSRKISI